MKFSKKTGRVIKDFSDEDEIARAVERIRIYGKRKTGRDDFQNVTSQSKLSEWIKDVTGHKNEGLARESMRVPAVRDMIETNKEQAREEIKIKKPVRLPIYSRKAEARKNKGIYVGTYMRRLKSGRRKRIPYAYDFESKKQLKLKDAV